MTDLAAFKVRFPEFASTSDERIQLFADEAELIMWEDGDRWLDFYDVANQYLVAHLLAIGNIQASGDVGVLSPVSKQEVDDVIVESAVGNRPYTADMLSSTSYGNQYMMYRRMCFAGIYGV